MELARVFDNKPSGKIYGLMGNIDITTNNIKYSLVTEFKFPNTVSEYLNSPKAINALKMVMLNESYLNKKVGDLSEAEIKKVILANSLIDNKPYLVLEYFEKDLTYKEKENFKRLFKKLADDYHKTIIIFTNDISFLWNTVDSLVYINEENVINEISKKDLFNFARIIDPPEIVKFIDLMHEKNIKVEDYKNVLDLLKAIYRIKGE